MLHYLVLCLVIMVFLTSAEEQKYPTKWDNIDVDEILQSERLLKNYVNCMLEKGSCTPDGTDLKRHLPDALQTDCIKCSERQKKTIKKVVDFLALNRKEIFKELQMRYDPENVYLKKYRMIKEQEGSKTR